MKDGNPVRCRVRQTFWSLGDDCEVDRIYRLAVEIEPIK